MKYVKLGGQYIVKLEIDEEVVETLTSFAEQMSIDAGVISGIGAVRDAVLGYFNPETHGYKKELLKGSYEVAGLHGTASICEGRSLLHLHATLADENHHTRAGHLFSAKVSVTLEVHFAVLPGKLERKKDAATNLNLLDM